VPLGCWLPCRSGIYPSKRRRNLLGRTGVDDEAVLLASRARAASTMAAVARHAEAEARAKAMPPALFPAPPAQPQSAAASAVASGQQGRDLLWAAPSDSFTAVFSGVYRAWCAVLLLLTLLLCQPQTANGCTRLTEGTLLAYVTACRQPQPAGE
jgi:hypothetical protein